MTFATFMVIYSSANLALAISGYQPKPLTPAARAIAVAMYLALIWWAVKSS